MKDKLCQGYEIFHSEGSCNETLDESVSQVDLNHNVPSALSVLYLMSSRNLFHETMFPFQRNLALIVKTIKVQYLIAIEHNNAWNPTHAMQHLPLWVLWSIETEYSRDVLHNYWDTTIKRKTRTNWYFVTAHPPI